MTQASGKQSMTPFELLGLEARMDLRRAEIDGAYRRAISKAHPDRAGVVQESDDARGVEDLNEARRVLTDPESRARALLDLLGADEGNSATRSADDALPDGFLMEIMGTRMEIEAELGELAGASAEDRERARDRWESWAQNRRDEAIASMTAHFERIGVADEGARVEAVAEARRALNAWRYIERLIEQLDPDHGPVM